MRRSSHPVRRPRRRALSDRGVARYRPPLHPQGRPLGRREVLPGRARRPGERAGCGAPHRPDARCCSTSRWARGTSWSSPPPSTTSANDFPLHASFVPFVDQTARYLGRLDAGPSSLPVGSYAELRDRQGNRVRRWTCVDPKGDRVLSLEEATKAQNIQFTLAGFYDMRRPNGRNELVAVNADRHESDLTPASRRRRSRCGRIQPAGLPRQRGGRAGRAETAFALVVCDAGGIGTGSGRVLAGKSTSFCG